MTTLRPSQVAEAAGVNLQTLKYYECRGLLPQPDRTLGGHRTYSDSTVTTLRVIKSAQRLGFTLAEIGDLLEVVWRKHRTSGAGLQSHLTAKLDEVDAKIASLTVIRESLQAAATMRCDDLATCLSNPDCPLSLGELADDLNTPHRKLLRS